VADDLSVWVNRLNVIADLCLPHQRTKDDEADLAVLKKAIFTVDGYEVGVYFNKERHAHFCGDTGEGQEFVLLSAQISSPHFPMLPFRLLLKIATAFLGRQHLCLSEFMVTGRKVYVWSVARDADTGDPIPVPLHPKSGILVYEDMEIVRAPATWLAVGGVS
jgi:hypothetical protein